jgi:23S rRNA (uridine2552-2'-O)-methyltransferase
MALAETAAMFAREVLRPGGTFLCKVLQGGTEGTLLADLKRDFATVKHVKPAASRADSAELYVLAMGFRGAGASSIMASDGKRGKSRGAVRFYDSQVDASRIHCGNGTTFRP